MIADELAHSPGSVQKLYNDIITYTEFIDISSEVIKLQRAYLDERILGSKWLNDALHVALATVSGCSMIISWNFKHIVNYQKIPLYNAVNVLNGYDKILIYSPLEVISDE